MLSIKKRFGETVALSGCLFALSFGKVSAGQVSLSAPNIVSNSVSFFFSSEINQFLTVERSSALASDWESVAHFQGTGAPISFSTHLNASQRLFRVKVSEVPPSGPELIAETLTFKAGEAVNIQLRAIGGIEPLSWSVDGVLPEGLSLSSDGLLSGTPTADAAEFNENGRFVNRIRVEDGWRNLTTGELAPRAATNNLAMLVRLSYAQNIYATRPDGPSLHHNCSICHSSDFKPDFDGGAAALIGALSGSGAECGNDRTYVSPPDASDSLIYEKVTERFPCGERMPFDGPYLSDKEIARLARWIRELGPDDED